MRSKRTLARRALGPTLTLTLLALAACGSDDGPERNPKVKRWATEVLPPTPPAAEREQAEAAERAARSVEKAKAEAAAKTTPTSPRDACQRLIDLACGALGPHSEECHEAQRVLPSERTPEWKDGCERIIDLHVTEPAPEWVGRRLNACRRFERRVCKDVGADTWQCRQARADASRLRWERPQACLGDLLAWEATRLFSQPAVSPSETER